MAACRGWGKIFRRALGMLSGPGALSLTRERRLEWNVCVLMIAGRRLCLVSNDVAKVSSVKGSIGG